MIRRIVMTLFGILLFLPIVFAISNSLYIPLRTITVSTSSISTYPEKIHSAPSERNISLFTYPGRILESSELLIMIINPTPSNISILVDFLVTREGFVRNFGEYRFNITGNVRIIASDPSRDYFVFVVQPFGVANIIITYTVRVPHNLSAGREVGRFTIYTERFERTFRITR